MTGRRALQSTECEKTTGAWMLLTAAMLGAAALLPSIARADLTLSGGVDYLSWTETTVPAVKETGLLYGFGVSYTQNRDAGALFAYRGKLWGGTVNYDGSTLFGNTPVKSTTNYSGLSNELQLRWRKPGNPGGTLDGIFGAGLDVWRRALSSVQKEDYSIGYLRLGVESGADDFSKWSVSLGFKYPIWTYENAHLDQIGFDSNPILHPGKEISPFGSLGYRLTPNLQLVGYYDGFRLSRSAPVQANEIAMGSGPTTLVQPASTMSVFGIKVEYRLR